MALLSSDDRKAAEAVAKVGYRNPFLPERMDLEKQILGRKFINKPFGTDLAQAFPNIVHMRKRAEQLATGMRDRLLAGESIDEAEARLYEDVVHYVLYSRYNVNQLDGLAERTLPVELLKGQTRLWKEFARDHAFFLDLPDRTFPREYEPSQIFATFFQIQRAFHNIFTYIHGRSPSIVQLRAAVWNSIFTRDIRRYARALYSSMDDVPTLIQGPSGTGKELVAQAVGRSRYMEFKNEEFSVEQADGFVAINLSALAPTLIESELFGHCKGAFSGATTDRDGYFGLKKPCIFLDEIGELDLAIQVKLLRVLQDRNFHRVGETEPKRFEGKIITATNRNLLDEIDEERFREDFYYRLCADLIHTPSLRQQLAECPEDLTLLVGLITRKMIEKCPEEADRLACEVVDWIRKHLAKDYDWPGNFRELNQCIRNVMIRGSYTPVPRRKSLLPDDPRQQLGEAVAEAKLKLPDFVRHYTSLAYALEGSYKAAGQRLGINWRTVKNNVSSDLVEQYQGSASPA